MNWTRVKFAPFICVHNSSAQKKRSQMDPFDRRWSNLRHILSASLTFPLRTHPLRLLGVYLSLCLCVYVCAVWTLNWSFPSCVHLGEVKLRFWVKNNNPIDLLYSTNILDDWIKQKWENRENEGERWIKSHSLKHTNRPTDRHTHSNWRANQNWWLLLAQMMVLSILPLLLK